MPGHTVRNHDFIFQNKEQLELNLKLIEKKDGIKKDDKLYLGRFVRFNSGLENDILQRYKSEGSPVEGDEYAYSSYAAKYVRKIKEICEKNNIELMFLTLPMYKEHISNYSEWKKTLSILLDKFSAEWLDMQELPSYEGFGTFAFENTYKSNQHMTYNGSLLATSKLAAFIKNDLKLELPNRDEDDSWHKLFYADESYFDYFLPSSDDANNKVIAKNLRFKNNVILKSLSHLNINNSQSNRVVAKLDSKNLSIKASSKPKLRLKARIIHNGV